MIASIFGRLSSSSIGTERLRILCFHGLWTAPGPHFGDKLFMSEEKFVSRLELVRRLGLEILPLPEAVSAMYRGKLPRGAAAITIDDGWASTFTHMLPHLERVGFPATIYLQTSRIETGSPVVDVAIRYLLEKAPDPSKRLRDLAEAAGVEDLPACVPDCSLVDRHEAGAALEILFAGLEVADHGTFLERLLLAADLDGTALRNYRAFDLARTSEISDAQRRGFELALHSHTHSLGDFSGERVSREIRDNRASLSRILDVAPDALTHFCWPSGEYTDEAVQTLQDVGITIATTCDPGIASKRSHSLKLPRFLDGETVSDRDFVLEVSGVKSGVKSLVNRFRRGSTRMSRTQ
jgi:peptidoglycan/xylan/chitin deacetylase (PgdA/CDA1 family)